MHYNITETPVDLDWTCTVNVAIPKATAIPKVALHWTPEGKR